MIVMTAVDDRMGMFFNGRRQSQDRVLRARILERCAGKVLWMNAYSARQFGEAAKAARVDEDFLTKAAPGEYCFAENVLPDPLQAEAVILYRWNRAYPGDFFFDWDLSGWVKKESRDFAGYSHEKITEEVYIREED